MQFMQTTGGQVQRCDNQEIKSLCIQNEQKIKKRARRNATLDTDTILSV